MTLSLHYRCRDRGRESYLMPEPRTASKERFGRSLDGCNCVRRARCQLLQTSTICGQESPRHTTRERERRMVSRCVLTMIPPFDKGCTRVRQLASGTGETPVPTP